MLKNPPGPRLTDTLRLSGSELKCAHKKKNARFCDFGVRFLVIVEGRATKEGRKKKTGRTKKEEEQQESKKSKFDPYTP